VEKSVKLSTGTASFAKWRAANISGQTRYAFFPLVFVAAFTALLAADGARPKATTEVSVGTGGIWAHNNLVAWCVVPSDSRARGPEARARMLARLGFRYFAYDGETENLAAEIEALQRHGLELLAWYFPDDAPDLSADATRVIFENFKHHHIHPQLWVTESIFNAPNMPKGLHMPKTPEEFSTLSSKEKEQVTTAIAGLTREDSTNTPAEQVRRVQQEVNRIFALVKLAAPYGIKVELYNHNLWFGMVNNQLAVIAGLRTLGVTDVGMIYNFSHALDEFHDDTLDFPALWKKMQPYVVAVNVTGVGPTDRIVFPSQGDHELEMMRIIQESGWVGPIGVIAENGGDAEITLKKNLIGLDWLAAELRQPGAGGPRPLFPN
jgi:hypothetical protein